MNFLISSNNQFKIKLLKRYLSQVFPGSNAFSLYDKSIDIDPVESGTTLLENARIKATEALVYINNNNISGIDYIVAEDFGFHIDAFPKIIGIHAKRWQAGSHVDRAKALLELFKDSKERNRKAEYRYALVILDVNNKEYSSRKVLKGEIVDTTQFQQNKFGYDQIFKIKGFSDPLSKLSDEKKDSVSFRRKALADLKSKISSI